VKKKEEKKDIETSSALLHIHYDMEIRPENIIERFAKSRQRKIVL